MVMYIIIPRDKGDSMKYLSLKSKSILFASIITILVSLIITSINYYMNMNATVSRLSTDSERTMKAWSKEVLTSDVEKLVATHDEELQKKMIAKFDKLANYQPQVAQGYLFGVELRNGSQTSVISGPTFLMEAFEKSGLLIGDFYTQPQVIADAIAEMKVTKKQTYSKIYTDRFGTWITVLKPLFNKDGEMFAYYGIDFDANAYLLGEYNKIKTTIIILVVLLLVVCLIQLFFMNRLFRPITIMQKKIARLNKGDYSVRLKESEDELGKLSKQLNILLTQLDEQQKKPVNLYGMEPTNLGQLSKQSMLLSMDIHSFLENEKDLNPYIRRVLLKEEQHQKIAKLANPYMILSLSTWLNSMNLRGRMNTTEKEILSELIHIEKPNQDVLYKGIIAIIHNPVLSQKIYTAIYKNFFEISNQLS